MILNFRVTPFVDQYQKYMNLQVNQIDSWTFCTRVFNIQIMIMNFAIPALLFLLSICFQMVFDLAGKIRFFVNDVEQEVVFSTSMTSVAGNGGTHLQFSPFEWYSKQLLLLHQCCKNAQDILKNMIVQHDKLQSTLKHSGEDHSKMLW